MPGSEGCILIYGVKVFEDVFLSRRSGVVGKRGRFVSNVAGIAWGLDHEALKDAGLFKYRRKV